MYDRIRLNKDVPGVPETVDIFVGQITWKDWLTRFPEMGCKVHLT